MSQCLLETADKMIKVSNKSSGFRKNDSKHPYFEGYYFKFINANKEIVIVIAGVSISKNEKYSFIQVASNYHKDVEIYKFPLTELRFSKDNFHFSIGENEFNENKIVLNLDHVSAEIRLNNKVDWKRSFWNPNIMGLLSYIPKMECKHDVITISTEVTGLVKLGDQKILFQKGDGYIEKNWGSSFPDKYMWIHANQFKTPNLSLQFAIARPKWIIFRPQVYIGYIMNGKLIHFGTHRLSLIKTKLCSKYTLVRINKINYKVTIKIKNKAPVNLLGPKEGNLNSEIYEYLNSEVQLTIVKKHLFKENEYMISESSKLSTTEKHNII